jgi:4-hydroxy-tetrahydrodipicolinate synthase
MKLSEFSNLFGGQMTTSEQLKGLLQGPVVAMTTPFNKDLSLDEKGVRTLIDFYCENKAGPIIVGGSTGELFSMTMDERKRLLEISVAQAHGRLPIIAGCPHSGTALALELVKHAKQVGADGAMVTPPYYTFSGFEGLYRHYEIITNECDLGILVYFSGAVLHMVQDVIANPALLEKICALPHISGFKDATGNFWFLRDVSIALKGKASVLASAGLSYYMYGWDYGTPGWITGIGNIWPKLEVDFWNFLKQGNRDAAQKMAFEVDRPYINYLKNRPKRYNYWAAVKALLDMEGLPGGLMRPPLLDWPKEDLPALRAAMESIGLLKSKAHA